MAKKNAVSPVASVPQASQNVPAQAAQAPQGFNMQGHQAQPAIPHLTPEFVQGALAHIQSETEKQGGTYVPPDVLAGLMHAAPGQIVETAVENNPQGHIFVMSANGNVASQPTQVNGNGNGQATHDNTGANEVQYTQHEGTGIKKRKLRAPNAPPIEKGEMFTPTFPIPMPAGTGSRSFGQKGEYTERFNSLSIGGCFLVPVVKVEDINRLKAQLSNVCSNRNAAAKNTTKVRFVARALVSFDARAYGYTAGMFNGVGVWRVA